MANDEQPLYVSRPSIKSMGNEYRVYPAHVELSCRFPFFRKTFVIARDDLVSIGVYQPPVLRTSLRALKVDLADLNEHVGLTRKTGFFKQLRFTPDDPAAFVAKVKKTFGLEQ